MVRSLAVLVFLSLASWLHSQESSGIHDGKAYITKSIFFGGGSYYIDGKQSESLADFLLEIEIENYEIHIHSHTDNIGGVEYNEWLSKMRSQSAIQLLMELAVPSEKILKKDHGLFNPDFNNDTWEGRAKNRRVDIVFWPLPS